MKRFFVVMLCALCAAVSLTGCTFLNNGQQQEEQVHIYYLETEDIDDSYSVGVYFNFSAQYCNSYFSNVDRGDVVQALAENTAYEMYGKVFGLTQKPVVTGESGQLQIGNVGEGVRWRAQYAYSRANGIELLAQVTAVDAEAFRDYLNRTSGSYMYGFVPSWDKRVGYTETQAYYNVYEGYRYQNPWSFAAAEWRDSYQGDGAMSALWQGSETAGVQGLSRYVNETAFARINEVGLLAYQFTSWHYNACNGYYSKNAGTRTCTWGGKVTDSLEMPSIYRRSPKVWAWYLTGLGIVAAVGFALYFGLRSGRKTLAQINPQSPPSKGPVAPDPFGDYASAPKKDDDNPFGSDYN